MNFLYMVKKITCIDLHDATMNRTHQIQLS